MRTVVNPGQQADSPGMSGGKMDWVYCPPKRHVKLVMRSLFNRLPLPLLVVLCLTLGLAPFTPEPHLWEKLKMLVSAELTEPLDIFDFLLHATPWLLLIIKLFFSLTGKPEE